MFSYLFFLWLCSDSKNICEDELFDVGPRYLDADEEDGRHEDAEHDDVQDLDDLKNVFGNDQVGKFNLISIVSLDDLRFSKRPVSILIQDKSWSQLIRL